MRSITCIALDPADLHVLPIDDLSIYNVVQVSGIETMITVLSVFSAFRTGFFADGCILCYVLDDIKRVLFYLINLAKLIDFDLHNSRMRMVLRSYLIRSPPEYGMGEDQVLQT
jgi:hypothetical protein